MNCISCDATNPENATSCEACGKSLHSAEDKDLAIDAPSHNSDSRPTEVAPINSNIEQAPLRQQQPSSLHNDVTETGLSLSLADYMPVPAPAPVGYPVYGPAAHPASMSPARLPRGIARPLPRWAFVTSIAVLVIGFILLIITGKDWAAGALNGALVAIVVASGIALSIGIRSLFGMASRANPHRMAQYVSSILAVFMLLIYSGLSLVLQPQFHLAQGHFLESQKSWDAALVQYKLTGEHAPDSENMARTYLEWGEDLAQQETYVIAVGKFNEVLDRFDAVNNLSNRAQQDKILALINLGKQQAAKKDYSDAIDSFNAAHNLGYCKESCQQQANALVATAHYNLAEVSLRSKDYAKAVDNFHSLLNDFPKSPEAAKLHLDMSKALLGKGKKDRAMTCSMAVPTYQELAKSYADTPEGQEAATELKVPQSVKGHFTSALPQDRGTLFALLVQGVTHGMDKNAFFSIADSFPSTNIASDGTFTFDPQKQGTYSLMWGVKSSSGVLYVLIYNKDDNKLTYTGDVGPLCPLDFGDIPQPFLASENVN